MADRELTPRQIVAELDRYIVGQAKAKRAVAIAMRNRYRREQLAGEMRGEIIPKNILMIGPTGVGKTEIARRLATLAGAPFVKVEATKYTEVGYVGRDVESMVRDLVEAAIRIVQDERRADVAQAADAAAVERVDRPALSRNARRRTARADNSFANTLGSIFGNTSRTGAAGGATADRQRRDRRGARDSRTGARRRAARLLRRAAGRRRDRGNAARCPSA